MILLRKIAGAIALGLLCTATGTAQTAGEEGSAPTPAPTAASEVAGESPSGAPPAGPSAAAEPDAGTAGAAVEPAPAPNVSRPIEDPATLELLRRAEEHFFQARYNIALRLFETVIEQAPENALAYRYAGDIHLKRGETDRALEYFEIARELSGEPAEEWFRIGQALYLKKEGARALDAFARARTLQPDLHFCLFYEGLVHFRLERDKAATIASWEEFRRLAPADAQGPAIDAALAVLRRADYEIPDFAAEENPPLPDASDSRVRYMPAKPAEERTDNKTEDIIAPDDL